MEKTLTLGSLFDGIGGFPYAASFYGIRSLWASEIMPECISVTRRHFPDMVHVGDITQLHGGKLPPVDIITFGSPCQGLSVSGLRRGLADERSGLFLEAVRIIYEMRETTHGEYPKFALWENVPGSTSSSSGLDYQAVLSALTKAEVPMPRSGRWANAGMARGGGVDLAWCVYDACHFGTAQRRRRVFLICDFRGNSAGEILFVPKSLRGYFEAGGTPRQGLAAFAESGADPAGGAAVEILNDQGGSVMSVERSGLSPTLRCQTHGNLPIVAMATGQANPSAIQNVIPCWATASPCPAPPTSCRASGKFYKGGVPPMAYVPVPKDLTKVKTKVMFNLTRRQLICFGGGALIGVPLFFILQKPLGNSSASLSMILVMLPFFLLAMYEKNGQPLEKVLGNILRVCFLRPKQRPYRTNNFYAALERQDRLDKEVYRIVHDSESAHSPPVRKERRRSGKARPGQARRAKTHQRR